MAPKITTLRLGHWSAEFRDSPEQHKQDCEKVFSLAKTRGLAWITGTEAGRGGGNTLRADLRAAAEKYGYTIAFREGNDTWVAVRKSLIAGGYTVHYEEVVTSKEGVGPHSSRGVLWVEFDAVDNLGHITVISAHYLTKGRPGQKTPDPNLAINKRYAATIDRIAREQGAGRGLVFYGGDQNIVDRTDDTFFGGIMVSFWDELGVHENTGHGNIDVIAASREDGRVTATSIRALSDREFFLHGDHFFVLGSCDVEQLEPPKPKPTLHKCGRCGNEHMGVVHEPSAG